MEIKIVCNCGTKFAFDVEPVHGRMPAPVNCPGCGADATGQANDVLRSIFSPAPVQPQPQPISAAAPPSGPLRINRPAQPAPAEVAAPAGALPSSPMSFRPASVGAEPKKHNPLVQIGTTVLLVVVIGFGAWRFGYKWYKRLNLVVRVASAAGEASVGNSGDSEGAKNLTYDDCAMLFIKHTNHLDVARACQDYWKTKLHKNLLLMNSDQEQGRSGEYQLIAAHNGYVRLLGEYEWPVAQLEGLAQHLSQTFGTQVFEWRSEHVADTYHFGVYDQGARKFHAQMDVDLAKDAEEVVTTEGNDFARAHGFKPGPKGFKEFNVLDADKITQRLGMKLWDEKEEAEVKGALLKEAAL